MEYYNHATTDVGAIEPICLLTSVPISSIFSEFHSLQDLVLRNLFLFSCFHIETVIDIRKKLYHWYWDLELFCLSTSTVASLLTELYFLYEI